MQKTDLAADYHFFGVPQPFSSSKTQDFQLFSALSGLTTGEPIIARVTVKPTPTIDKPQKTIDKYTLENKDLAAITRRDATIVGRIWPVAENYTAIVILDHLLAHYGYQTLRKT